jgi:hypothetical protein
VSQYHHNGYNEPFFGDARAFFGTLYFLMIYTANPLPELSFATLVKKQIECYGLLVNGF